MSKKKPTLAAALAGAGDAPITDLSTTRAIEPPVVGACHGCDTHDVQFVTRAGVTTLRCKVCDSEVQPTDAGEAQSLADYNRKA